MATKKPVPDYLRNEAPAYNYSALDDFLAAQPASQEEAPKPTGLFRRFAQDAGTAALKTAIAVPESAVGLANLVSGGRAGKLVQDVGVDFKRAQDIASGFYSPETQAAQKAVESEVGFFNKLGAAVANPSVIATGAAESIGPMLAGGVLARGVMAVAPRIGGLAAGAIGEGVTSAGAQAEQIRQETPDGLLTPMQSGAAAVSGVATSAFGLLGGKIAKKLGIGDIDTLIAGGAPGADAVKKSLVRKVLEGAFSEGVLEELPQSISDQVLQNYALGKPLDQGVDQAAVLGMLSGGLMGGGAQLLPNRGPLSRAANVVAPVVPPGGSEMAPPAPAPLAPEQTQALLDMANRRAAELNEKATGTKDQKMPGPDGKPIVIPGKQPEFLTPDEKAEIEFLKEKGGDAQALARAYPGLVQPPAAAPAAPAATIDQTTGEVPPPAPVVPTVPTGNDPAAVAQREADRPPEPTDPVLEGDILNKLGRPFLSMPGAISALAKAGDGYEIKRVQGGLVLRPKAGTTTEQTPPAAGIPQSEGTNAAAPVKEGGALRSVAPDTKQPEAAAPSLLENAVTPKVEPPAPPAAELDMGQPAAPRTVKVNDQTVALTPEQSAEWDKVGADYKAKFDAAKATFERNSKAKPRADEDPDIGARTAKEEYDATQKRLGMELSAERRRIAGVQTPKEKAAADKLAGRIRPGDTVQTPQGTGTVVGNTFGKVRVQVGDQTITVPHADATKTDAAPVQTQAEIPEAAAPTAAPAAPEQPADVTGTGSAGVEASGVASGANARGAFADVQPGAKIGQQDAAASQRSQDGVLRDAELLGDGVATEALREKGLGGLDVPTRRAMVAHVVNALQDREVRQRVVELVPVEMMNVLVGEKRSAEVALHDPAVLKDLFSINSEATVTARSDVADALAIAVATVAAERAAAGPLMRGLTDEAGAAVGADKIDGKQVNSPTRIDEPGPSSGPTVDGPPTVSTNSLSVPSAEVADGATAAAPTPSDGAAPAPVADTAGDWWATASEKDRTDTLIKAGWTATKGVPSPSAVEVAGKAWDKLRPAQRARITAARGQADSAAEQAPAPAPAAPAPQDVQPGDVVRVTTGPLNGTMRTAIRPATDGAPGWVVSDSQEGEKTVVGVEFVRRGDAAVPAPASDKVAPGTRTNGAPERAAADRLEKLAESFYPKNANSPEGAARQSLRSIAGELRKERTVNSVEAILEQAAQRLDRQFSAQADVVREVLAGLSGKVEAASPVPASASKRPPAAGKAAQLREQNLRTYFAPGNVVKSYGGGHDEVISLTIREDGGFLVKVHAVTKGQASGQWVRLGKPQEVRQHSTFPDARELKGGPVAQLLYQPGNLVSYTEGRADGQPFPNAPDRGVKQEAVPAPSPSPALAEPAAPRPPVTVAKAPKAEPTANTIFTEDAAAAARARLKAKLGRVQSGIDPETLVDGITLAGYHIEKGARTFAAYARAMVDDLGDAVKPYLQSWYMAVRADPRASAFRADMDKASAVEDLDIDQVLADATPAAPTQNLRDTLFAEIKANRMPKDNPALRKLVEQFDGQPATPVRMKQAQEDLEAAIVMMARKLVSQNEGDRSTFGMLTRLYESQPNLNIRTSTSVDNQAYSTPAPLAWVGSRLAGIGKKTSVYEPTGGNGMLTITAAPANVTATELDDQRFQNLRDQGINATQGDALKVEVPAKSQDAVHTNPPFGPIKNEAGESIKVKFDGYTMGQIDHLIAARALDAMKDDGSATLIIGANKVTGQQSNNDLIFFNWLYGNYRITSHFEVDGDLYRRQGAGWPVRVITIQGRKRSDTTAPNPSTIGRASTWSEVYERFEQGLGAQRATAGDRAPAVGAGSRQADDARPVPGDAGGQARRADPSRPEGGAAGDGNVAGRGARAVGDRRAVPVEPVGERPGAQRPDASSAVADDGRRQAGDASRAEPGRDSRTPGLTAAENQFQTAYVARSARKDEGVLIPVNMAGPTQDGLNRLEDEVGDIDKFAAKELGYPSVKALHTAFMGLQVDSVASAIYQIKAGKGVIIADQTGIGKGRQAAGIIRWAVRNGKVPVFVTVKPSLFTDMYGDLRDIGTDDVAPLILNAAESIKGEADERLFANRPGLHKRTIEGVAGTGQLPAGRNALFMTYSQINVDNVQRRAVMALAPNAVFVLDESHNAGGDSQTGQFIRDALGLASGVTYLSATYAKRPNNMPVYFKTDIGEAVADDETLMDAMDAGGLPLQTVVANNLVKAGQMFRRERSYDGVSIESRADTEHKAEHVKLSDITTLALRAIVKADRTFHEMYVKALQKELAKDGSRALDMAGNQAQQSVDHTQFSSVVHNFVRQMLLGLKAQEAANDAIRSLKQGEKPLIAVENTMGSFLAEYAENNSLKVGDPLGAFDYRTVLSRALERSRYIVKQLPNGDKVKEYIPPVEARPDQPDRLRPGSKSDRWARDRHPGVADRLDAQRDYPGRLHRGRGHRPQLGRRLQRPEGSEAHAAGRAREQKDKVHTTRQFNAGELDALVLNVAGSTGISLHASEKFTDQRQRHMIVAQAAQDINIFMQMLGRVHRTGQVRLPKYTILSADLPAEIRPTALLSGKMKSLNANTSSNTESATSVRAADMLNKYGDQIVGQYLADNPKLALELGLSGTSEVATDDGPSVDEDIARKATGRLALMPVKVQEQFYAEVEEQYNALLEYLNKTNQNDLEPRTFDFDAKETKSVLLFEGQNKQARSARTPSTANTASRPWARR